LIAIQRQRWTEDVKSARLSGIYGS